LRFINYVKNNSKLEWLVDDVDNPTRIMFCYLGSYSNRSGTEKCQKFVDKYGDNRIKKKFPVFEVDFVFDHTWLWESSAGWVCKDVDTDEEFRVSIVDQDGLMDRVELVRTIEGNGDVDDKKVYRMKGFYRKKSSYVYFIPFVGSINEVYKPKAHQLF